MVLSETDSSNEEDSKGEEADSGSSFVGFSDSPMIK
jgi:hypothetical protein